MKIHRNNILANDESDLPQGDVDQKKRYRRLLRYTIALVSIVAITPLIIMTMINFYQYRKAYRSDIVYPITRQTTNIKQSLESFLHQRVSALKLVAKEKKYEDLTDLKKLVQTLRHLKESCPGFIDLSVIDSEGKQVAYVGPYNLLGKDYKDQEWFNETSIKGVHISEVFLGYRNLPHFLIAILNETENLNYYIIRSTIDTDELYRQITAQKLLPSSDAFLINKDGVLQTPSRFHGDVLETTDVPIPRYADEYGVIERDQVPDAVEILGYAYINNSPFILLETFHPESMMGDWLSGRNDILLILTISITVILIVIVWGSRHMVRQIEISDQKRTRILHQVEYTSKMASIGRLAAGVSHEINNPLAIINENAGMIQDILSVTSDFPRKEKVLKNINSITRSVERCSKITHRLLGFAKRIDTQTEDIRLDELIKEVAGFMSRESMARNIKFIFENIESDIEIRSDRGQLQQVFLNIINNAVDAVDDGGVIRINIIRSSEEFVKVSISDNGEGIPPGEIDRIFEPFFTRKKEKGTGLGLAITYGIIQKLGGRIEVDSQLNVGTNFDIFLPVNPPSERINHEV